MSLDAYRDVEAHADEFISAISLASAKAICAALNLKVTNLVILEPLSAPLHPALPAALLGWPRRRMVKAAREALGASVAEVADSIGFEAQAIERAESEDAYLDTLPIQVLADLAARLQLPLHTLIA
jgi:DNA-binding XRE family transcriptional regulator